jgi:hypothetical protein
MISSAEPEFSPDLTLKARRASPTTQAYQPQIGCAQVRARREYLAIGVADIEKPVDRQSMTPAVETRWTFSSLLAKRLSRNKCGLVFVGVSQENADCNTPNTLLKVV